MSTLSARPLHQLFRSVGMALALAASQAYGVEFGKSYRDPVEYLTHALSPSLDRMEDRYDFLQERLESLAPYWPSASPRCIGFMGARQTPNEEPPWVTIDLGHAYPIHDIFLVPTPSNESGSEDLFPRRFDVQVSNTEDFSQAEVVFAALGSRYPSPKGLPVHVRSQGKVARYVRLRVMEGIKQSYSDVFALSEIFVICNNEPISLGCKVTSSWSLGVKNLWEPQFLTDGSTPLGQWQSARWSPSPGCVINLKPGQPDSGAIWTIDLGQSLPIDRIHIHPLALNDFPNIAILPEDFTFAIGEKEDGSDATVIHTQEAVDGPLNIGFSPVSIQAHQHNARYLHLRSSRPWSYGSRRIYGLAEIEAFSGGENVALNQPAHIHLSSNTSSGSVPVTEITDGFASRKQLIYVGTWLAQLAERLRLERELDWITPQIRYEKQESEINAMWLLAVGATGLMLIPLLILERRRLVSRKHLDTLRNRIASDLHDDIGSNLGSISLIARSAKKDLERAEASPSLLNDLNEVETVARESSLAMRDIVWLLEQRQDTIGDLVKRMRDTGSRLMRGMDYAINCESVENDPKQATLRLTLDAKRHLFLFFKESLHNIVKHAKATAVSVRMYRNNDKLILETTDNGIGLSPDQLRSQTTVHKLEERARVLGGQLELSSQPNQGTTIRLIARISPLTTKRKTS